MSTTIGVMHNLPVLWLAVGLLPIGHALVFPIVGHWKVALLLCVVHAVQCAVSVPGLWSRQQWQLVWVGPRVLLCPRAETGRRGRLQPAMAQRLRPTLRLWPPVSVSLSPLHLKSHPQMAMDWEKDDGSDESTTVCPPTYPPSPHWTKWPWVWLSLCAMNWPPQNQQVNMQKCFLSHSSTFTTLSLLLLLFW